MFSMSHSVFLCLAMSHSASLCLCRSHVHCDTGQRCGLLLGMCFRKCFLLYLNGSPSLWYVYVYFPKQLAAQLFGSSVWQQYTASVYSILIVAGQQHTYSRSAHSQLSSTLTAQQYTHSSAVHCKCFIAHSHLLFRSTVAWSSSCATSTKS